MVVLNQPYFLRQIENWLYAVVQIEGSLGWRIQNNDGAELALYLFVLS
jgi:hypothetical protein